MRMSAAVTLPPGSSLARTDAVVQQVVPIVLGSPGVSSASVYSGMDPNGFMTASYAGQMWAIFDPFDERLKRGLTDKVIAAELTRRLAGITAADIRITTPAPARAW